MTEAKEYVANLLARLSEKNKGETEYLQAVKEFLDSLIPYLAKSPEAMTNGVMEMLLEPERIIQFRVPWLDDQGGLKVNRGFRVQYNSALGPYKGGLRFHPSVNQSIMKFLSFEQIFKNSLTGLSIGGGKGGSDFDPKGKSDAEIMRFCQSFMTELQKYIGPDTDIPAGDIGVGAREIGYLYGQYKRLNSFQGGVLTGKPVLYGGSLGRTEATGYGLVYMVQNMLADENLQGKRVMVSGSGNVAIYAMEKAQQLGAIVIGCSDSNGYIIDEAGIAIDLVKQIKEVDRSRIKNYVDVRPDARYTVGNIWQQDVTYEIALPCATQNEIGEIEAQKIIANGAKVVAEGANMPSDLVAIQLFQEQLLFMPGKAANAGGVAVSGLEMSQNSQRLRWNLATVDEQLADIMAHIYVTCRDTAKTYHAANNFVLGANIAGFEKVTKAMLSQGAV